MRPLELSPRLAALAAQVPQGAKVADVGTDHAYLPTWLLLQGRVRAAIASDVNDGPLDRGRETARTYGVTEGIAFRRCDGLAGLAAGEADTVIIAGMGGDLIARILSAAPWTRQTCLLLQPMSAQEELRRWLVDHGYVIQQETLAEEGDKRYTILRATGGASTPYTTAELLAGRQQPGDVSPHRLAHLEDLLRRRRRALAGMARGKAPDPAALARETALIEELEQMREEWSQWQR